MSARANTLRLPDPRLGDFDDEPTDVHDLPLRPPAAAVIHDAALALDDASDGVPVAPSRVATRPYASPATRVVVEVA